MRFALIYVFAAHVFALRLLACHVLEGDRITGKDLASASASFAALDPALILAPAPVPGVQRVLHPQELLRIARGNAIDLPAPASEICFERATDPLTPEKLQPVLETALALEGAKIEILDFSRAAVPRGSLSFNRAGLSASGLWRGQVDFDENRSMSIWARVRVTTEQTWVETTQPLAAGKTAAAAQLKLVTGPRFPFGTAPAATIDSVAGQTLLRAVRPGEPIFSYMLIAPHEVERGDRVAVEVSAGSAHLSFDAVSQSSGRTGELVLLKNPENGRFFQARVEGKDKASITK
jgi:flagella basal body P-ring formation protein FlgA